MKDLIIEISEALSQTKWQGIGKTADISGFPTEIPNHWPFSNKLYEILLKPQVDKAGNHIKDNNGKVILGKLDERGRPIGLHIKGVIASINTLIKPKLSHNFLVSSGDQNINGRADGLLSTAHSRSWHDKNAIFIGSQNKFPRALLRIAALYHDIGKIISTDLHVTRGLRLMRDIEKKDRDYFENLFESINERNRMWALLRHHDIYGTLCTGEASLAAFSDIVSWTHPEFSFEPIDRSIAAYLTYLLWLNIADSDSTLRTVHGGITSVEADRYLSDWHILIHELLDNNGNPKIIHREEFKKWSLIVASTVTMTIQRITRLIATCYRMKTDKIAPYDEILTLVEEELISLYGHRLEEFCYRFARFCKLDYALRFFLELMKDPRMESNEDHVQLRNMTYRTCMVLQRITEDYAHLINECDRSSPLLVVNMTGLMNPPETGRAICKSLKESPSRALGWIAEEIGVWLYGE